MLLILGKANTARAFLKLTNRESLSSSQAQELAPHLIFLSQRKITRPCSAKLKKGSITNEAVSDVNIMLDGVTYFG